MPAPCCRITEKNALAFVGFAHDSKKEKMRNNRWPRQKCCIGNHFSSSYKNEQTTTVMFDLYSQQRINFYMLLSSSFSCVPVVDSIHIVHGRNSSGRVNTAECQCILHRASEWNCLAWRNKKESGLHFIEHTLRKKQSVEATISLAQVLEYPVKF